MAFHPEMRLQTAAGGSGQPRVSMGVLSGLKLIRRLELVTGTSAYLCMARYGCLQTFLVLHVILGPGVLAMTAKPHLSCGYAVGNRLR